MLLINNYINEKNNISITINPAVELESIITTVSGCVNGNYFKYKYYRFKDACRKFKKVNERLKQYATSKNI